MVRLCLQRPLKSIGWKSGSYDFVLVVEIVGVYLSFGIQIFLRHFLLLYPMHICRVMSYNTQSHFPPSSPISTVKLPLKPTNRRSKLDYWHSALRAISSVADVSEPEGLPESGPSGDPGMLSWDLVKRQVLTQLCIR